MTMVDKYLATEVFEFNALSQCIIYTMADGFVIFAKDSI